MLRALEKLSTKLALLGRRTILHCLTTMFGVQSSEAVRLGRLRGILAPPLGHNLRILRRVARTVLVGSK